MDLVVIYDFDGTLTPYSLPQYKILKKCGYDDNKIMSLIQSIMEHKNMGLYEAFCDAIYTIMVENNIERTVEAVCEGAEQIEFNLGVISYFKKFKSVNHFVVTSGYEEYVRRTAIAPYLKEIYGTKISLFEEDFQLDYLMTDEKKVEAIEKISKDFGYDFKNMIYIGDGLTDKYAFEYIHNHGGTAIYIGERNDEAGKLIELGIIDECFDRNFEAGSGLAQYMESRLEENEK